MKFDLSQQFAYIADMERAIADLEKAKERLTYAKLQLKQTKEAAARGRRDPVIKQLVAAFGKDRVEVMPSPGVNYVTVYLKPTDSTYGLDVQTISSELRFVERHVIGAAGCEQITDTWTTPGVRFYVIKLPF